MIAATAGAAAEPASKPEQVASDLSKSPTSSPRSSVSAGGAAEPKKQDYNTTSGVSEVVQQQMDQGVDAAAASAMEYANYLSGQRTEGYGATASEPPVCSWCLSNRQHPRVVDVQLTAFWCAAGRTKPGQKGSSRREPRPIAVDKFDNISIILNKVIEHNADTVAKHRG